MLEKEFTTDEMVLCHVLESKRDLVTVEIQSIVENRLFTPHFISNHQGLHLRTLECSLLFDGCSILTHHLVDVECITCVRLLLGTTLRNRSLVRLWWRWGLVNHSFRGKVYFG